MDQHVPTLELHDGTRIPQMGFGTYKIEPEETARAVLEALRIGYRHIDTAQMYGNEEGVGRALAQAALAREDFYLTTKLDNPHHKPADVDRSMDESLQKLGVDQVDLFLVHWPLAMEPELDLVETWRAMENLRADGRARSIGVSNYQPDHLRTLIDAGCEVPAVNQVEVHPWLSNRVVRAFHDQHHVLTEAWSPLGRGAVLEDETVVGIAERLEATAAQVILAWHLQQGRVVIPKSVNPERMASNLAATELHLSEEDLAEIDALDRGEAGRQGSHPDEKTLR